jgi:hypothetical protein
MTAPYPSREPIALSCSERIVRLVAERDQAGLDGQSALSGVRLDDAASVNGQIHGRATRVFILHEDPGHARSADDADARFQHCYRVQPALVALELPPWQAGGGRAACLTVQFDL